MKKIFSKKFTSIFFLTALFFLSFKNIKADEIEYPFDFFEDAVWQNENIEGNIYVTDGVKVTFVKGDHNFDGSISLGSQSEIVFEEGNYIFKEHIISNDKGKITFEKGTYIFENDLKVSSGSEIIMKPGVNIIFSKSNLRFNIEASKIKASGTEKERIKFFSSDEESSDYQIGISGFNSGEDYSFFNNVDFIGGGKYYPGGGVLSKNIFNKIIKTANADDVEYVFSGFATLKQDQARLKIINSKFEKSNYYPISFEFRNYDDGFNPNVLSEVSNTDFDGGLMNLAIYSKAICDFRYICPNTLLNNNWYGSFDGPKTNQFPERKGAFIFGRAIISDWSNRPYFPNPSNILFLPGIKTSRLYKNGIIGNDKLWPPNYFGNDIEELFLNENGESENDVFTEDVIDELAVPIVGGNIYKTFLQNLDNLKENKTINDFGIFAYDWRFDVKDIVEYGALYPQDEIKSAISEIERLANSSKSKKVTIVAHSNGGLLAKATMLKLQQLDYENKIDKIIFIGTPQIGTPISILSMLYGYDETAIFGTLISQKNARKFIENMPAAYGLLPSEKYLGKIQDPIINFSSKNTRYNNFINAYGSEINTKEEFQSFLLGKDDEREKPPEDETEKENILNKNLLEKAEQLHSELDDWKAPGGVDIIQIAGWGLDTISNIEYSEKQKTNCNMLTYSVPTCTTINEYEPTYEPKFTSEGDGIVVAHSALDMKDDFNVKKYWVDLYRSNKIYNIGREHKNLLELDSLEIFLTNIINNTYKKTLLPQFISSLRPADYENASPKIRMSVHSPLDIHLYDESGNHTGPKEIEIEGQRKIVFEKAIPNSYYYQFGDRKYVGFSKGENISVEMKGTDNGSYILKIEEIKEDENGQENIILHNSFLNLPILKNGKVEFNIPQEGLSNMTKLEADLDGDNIFDYEVSPVINGEATLKIEDEKSIQSIINDIKKYFDQGLIKTKQEKNILLTSLNIINQKIKFLAMIEKNKHIGKNAKKIIEKVVIKEITFQIDFLINHINKNSSKYEKNIKNIIMEDLKWIKGGAIAGTLKY